MDWSEQLEGLRLPSLPDPQLSEIASDAQLQ